MKTSIATLVIALISSGIYGQEMLQTVISSAGKSFQGNNIQLDWTIGEVAISTMENSSSMISQGMHQPVYTVTGIKTLPLEIGTVEVYPNPVADEQNLYINLTSVRELDLQLTNAVGKLLWQKHRTGQVIHEKYSLADLPAGSYFLTIAINDILSVHTYHIVKSN